MAALAYHDVSRFITSADATRHVLRWPVEVTAPGGQYRLCWCPEGFAQIAESNLTEGGAGNQNVTTVEGRAPPRAAASGRVLPSRATCYRIAIAAVHAYGLRASR